MRAPARDSPVSGFVPLTPSYSVQVCSGPILDRVSAPRSESSTLLERVLAYALLAVVVLSVVCFFAIMIGTWNGMQQGDFADGIWPIITMAPYVGLPLAVLLLIALVLINGSQRSRANRQR